MTCQQVWSPMCHNFGHHCDHHDARLETANRKCKVATARTRKIATAPFVWSGGESLPGVHEGRFPCSVRGLSLTRRTRRSLPMFGHGVESHPACRPRSLQEPSMAPRWSEMAPRPPKMARRWPQNGPKTIPKWLQGVPKRLKTTPTRPKAAQRGTKTAPTRPKTVPRGPQEGPR